jgi:hypothetical protein
MSDRSAFAVHDETPVTVDGAAHGKHAGDRLTVEPVCVQRTCGDGSRPVLVELSGRVEISRAVDLLAKGISEYRDALAVRTREQGRAFPREAQRERRYWSKR